MENPLQTEQIMPTSPGLVQDGKPYFMGEQALVKFSDGGEYATYWLVDKGDHTVRPFESELALDAAFGEELEMALRNAMTIATPKVDESGNIMEGILSDFSLLGPEYSIHDDGTTKPLHFSPHQLKNRYGKPIDEKSENLAAEVVDGFLNLLKNNSEQTEIPADFVDELKNDSQLMAFYISALAYGNYTMEDLYSDISRRFFDEMDEKTIDPTKPKSGRSNNITK